MDVTQGNLQAVFTGLKATFAEAVRSTCVSTFVSGARKCLKTRGIGTIRSRYAGRSPNGRKVYKYWFEPWGVQGELFNKGAEAPAQKPAAEAEPKKPARRSRKKKGAA